MERILVEKVVFVAPKTEKEYMQHALEDGCKSSVAGQLRFL